MSSTEPTVKPPPEHKTKQHHYKTQTSYSVINPLLQQSTPISSHSKLCGDVYHCNTELM